MNHLKITASLAALAVAIGWSGSALAEEAIATAAAGNRSCSRG